jgi:hypothetical protein
MARVYPVGPEGEAQTPYGERRPAIQRFRLRLDNARNEERFNKGGNVLWAVQASSYTAIAEIAFHQRGQGQIPFSSGTFVRAGPFSEIFVTNSAQSGEWIDLLHVREKEGLFEIQNPGSVFDTVQLVTPTQLLTYADVSISAGSTTLITNSAAVREEIIVQSHPDNTNRVRIGDNNASGSRGIILEPGESATLNVTSSVYGYNVNNTGDNTDVVIATIDTRE